MILAAGPGPAPVLSVAWRSQNRPALGTRAAGGPLCALERASVRGRCLAAVILVFWSQPTAVVALLIAVVLLSCWA